MLMRGSLPPWRKANGVALLLSRRCTEKCPDSPLGTRRGEGFVWGQEDSSPQCEGSWALTDGMVRNLRDDPGTAEH